MLVCAESMGARSSVDTWPSEEAGRWYVHRRVVDSDIVKSTKGPMKNENCSQHVHGMEPYGRRGAEEHSMERRLSRRLCCNRSRRRPTYASKLVVPQRSISFFMLLILVSGVRTLVQCNIRLVRSEPLLLIWFGSDPALIFKKKVQRNCNTALNMGRNLRKLEIPFKIWRWGLPPSTWPAEGYAGLQSK